MERYGVKWCGTSLCYVYNIKLIKWDKWFVYIDRESSEGEREIGLYWFIESRGRERERKCVI